MAHFQQCTGKPVLVDGCIINTTTYGLRGTVQKSLHGDQTCGNDRLSDCSLITTTAQVTADSRPVLPSAVSASSVYLPLPEKIERQHAYHSDKEVTGKVLPVGEPWATGPRYRLMTKRTALFISRSIFGWFSGSICSVKLACPNASHSQNTVGSQARVVVAGAHENELPGW